MLADELDRILDDALASYSSQEPRAGLPGRVLAAVRADGARRRGGWLLLAAVVAAVGCLAVVTVMWRGENRQQPIPWSPPNKEVPQDTEVKVEQPRDVPRRVESVRLAYVQRPRLGSFPGPAPPSPEELALIALAQQAPKLALQLALAHKPLEIAEIEIRPIQIDGLPTGGIK